jgi:hypothetical protein
MMFPTNQELLDALSDEQRALAEEGSPVFPECYWMIPALTSYLRPAKILELGTNEAVSCRLFRAFAPGAEITTVDAIGGYSKFVENLNVRFICSSTQELAKTWTEDIDLLYIDTEHDFNTVTAELESFGKSARKAILVHDILSSPPVAVAIKAWLNEDQWEYHPYEEKYGMGVLWRRI